MVAYISSGADSLYHWQSAYLICYSTVLVLPDVLKTGNNDHGVGI